MDDQFVKVGNNKIMVEQGHLNLLNQGIKDISEIEGLENLINLRVLILADNQITEIKGLEYLTKYLKIVV